MKDMFTNLNLTNSAITLAAFGYILNLLKFIPIKIWELIKQKYMNSVYVTSSNKLLYYYIESDIANYCSKVFTKYVSSIDEDVNKILLKDCKSIAIGKYTYIDWKTKNIILIYKVKANQTNFYNDKSPEIYNLTIDVIGFNTKAIINHYKEIIAKYNRNELFSNTNYVEVRNSMYHGGSIYESKYISKYSFDTIFDKINVNKIKHFINDFVTNEEFYKSNSIKWKTGLLLYGPPGTGKSSFATAIASELNWPIYTITGLSFSGEIVELIKKIAFTAPAKSIILIDELDRIMDNPSIRDTEYKKELSGSITNSLLQLLDSINSPEGVIFIATTNNIDILDPALIRDGRFDLKLEMKGITKNDVLDMLKHFNLNESILDFELKDDEFYNPSQILNKILHK